MRLPTHFGEQVLKDQGMLASRPGFDAEIVPTVWQMATGRPANHTCSAGRLCLATRANKRPSNRCRKAGLMWSRQLNMNNTRNGTNEEPWACSLEGLLCGEIESFLRSS
jgi:hypothetical protein